MMQQPHHVVSLGGHGIPPPPPPAPLHPRTDPGILQQVLATLEQLAASDLNMLQNFVTQLGTTSPAALADAVLLFFRNPATTLNQAVLGMNFAPTQGALSARQRLHRWKMRNRKTWAPGRFFPPSPACRSFRKVQIVNSRWIAPNAYERTEH